MVVQFFLFWIRAQVTIDDNVHAQHKLLHHLGLDLVASPLDMIYGYRARERVPLAVVP